MIPDDIWLILQRDIEGGDQVISDAGGLTKWGISQRAYPSLDIANLTEDAARRIALSDYWLPIRGDALPAHLQFPVFDSAFNQGPGMATRLLQSALNIAVDGVVGNMTIAHANTSGLEALHRFNARRCMRYAAGDGGSWHSWFHRVSITTAYAARAYGGGR